MSGGGGRGGGGGELGGEAAGAIVREAERESSGPTIKACTINWWIR